MAREIDVDAIQENIVAVTYCNIEHELVCLHIIVDLLLYFAFVIHSGGSLIAWGLGI